jgi:hypothetical protein
LKSGSQQEKAITGQGLNRLTQEINMPTFTYSQNAAELLNAILDVDANLTISTSTLDDGTFSKSDGTIGSSASLYDGSIQGLGMDAGILLTSGDGAPPLNNTTEYYTQSLGMNFGDDDLYDVAQKAFYLSGETRDTTILEFSFTAPDHIENIKFDLVFASDEYPEFSDSAFVDVAAVFVNGQNYALFKDQAEQPLCIIDTNLSLGNFLNNTDQSVNDATTQVDIGLEYDGISKPLTIQAPINPGQTNTIKIGIADTGDCQLDSGLFLANFTTEETGHGEGGLFTQLDGTGLADSLGGTVNDDFILALSGDDSIDPKGGNDVVLAGEGDDTIIGGNGKNDFDGGAGTDTVTYSGNLADYTIKDLDAQVQIIQGENSDSLANVEWASFADQDLELSTVEPGGASLLTTQNGFLLDGSTFADVLSPGDSTYVKLWDQSTGNVYTGDGESTFIDSNGWIQLLGKDESTGETVATEMLENMKLPYETNKFYVTFYSPMDGQSAWTDFNVTSGPTVAVNATVGLTDQELPANSQFSYDQLISTEAGNLPSEANLYIKAYDTAAGDVFGGYIDVSSLDEHTFTTGSPGEVSNIWIQTYQEANGGGSGWENFKVTAVDDASDDVALTGIGAESDSAALGLG